MTKEYKKNSFCKTKIQKIKEITVSFFSLDKQSLNCISFAVTTDGFYLKGQLPVITIINYLQVLASDHCSTPERDYLECRYSFYSIFYE